MWMPPPTSMQRALRVGEQRRGALDVGSVGPRAARRRRRSSRIGPEVAFVELVFAVATSSGTSTTTGPGRPRGRDRERAADVLRDALDDLDPDHLLGHRPQDLELPRLLRHVLPGVVAVRIADDRDDRDAGVERLDQAGHEVGGAGAERRIDHADAAGDARIGIGRERAAALVVDQVCFRPSARHAS